jgi:hypothetical protein
MCIFHELPGCWHWKVTVLYLEGVQRRLLVQGKVNWRYFNVVTTFRQYFCTFSLLEAALCIRGGNGMETLCIDLGSAVQCSAEQCSVVQCIALHCTALHENNAYTYWEDQHHWKPLGSAGKDSNRQYIPRDMRHIAGGEVEGKLKEIASLLLSGRTG